MTTQKKKKPRAAKIDWRQILIQAAIDFIIGLLLDAINRLLS